MFAAALTAALTMGAAVVAAPAASAEEPQQGAVAAAPSDGQVADATLDWGVKQSFRNYLFGPIAHGDYELLGNTTASAENLRPAAEHLSWSGGTGSAATDGSAADVGFGAGNGVHFTGHYMEVDGESGDALDMQFTNPRVEVTSASEGTLYLDVKSRKFEDTTSISQEFFEQDGVPFATLDLDAPAADGTTFTWTDVAATLTETGAQAFGGFYEAGEVLDPVSFTLPVQATEDPGDGSADPGDGSEDPGDGSDDPGDGSEDPGDGSADPGDGSEDPGDGTDTAVETTTTVVASNPKPTEGDEVTLRAAVAPQAAAGEVQFADGDADLEKAVEVKNGVASLRTSELSVGTHRITAKFTPKDPKAFTASTSDPEEVVVAKKQTGPEEGTIANADLDWGVKASFRSYLQGPIAHGEIELLGAATSDDDNMRPADRQFHWTGGSGKAMTDGSTADVTFGADDGVYFTGHEMTVDGQTAPALDMRFTKPRVEITSSGTGVLYLDVKSREFKDMNSISQKFFEEDNVPFAELELDAPKSDGSTYTWTDAAATLTEKGALAFGGFYEAGDELDPVTFSGDIEGAEEPAPTPEKTTTKLSVSRDSITVGNEVALTALVSPAQAGGTVHFTNGGTNLGAQKVKNGKATLKTTKLPAGALTLTASFTPDDAKAYRASSGSTEITVNEKSTGKTVGSMQWGIKDSFRKYVVGKIAQGKFTTSGGATQAKNNGVFSYKQAKSGTKWNGKTGYVQYAGNVKIYGHHGMMDVNIANPKIKDSSATKAEMVIPFGKKKELTLATIDLAKGKKQTLGGGATRFSGAEVKLSKAGAEQVFVNNTGEGPAGTFYEPGTVMDKITFTIGEGSSQGVTDPPKSNPKPKPQPKQEPKAAATSGGGAGAGSLKWGVSKYFADYTTKKSGSGCPTPSKHCAGGSIATSGVGGGWLFPQAEGSSWNKSSQTGTVKFSGVVSFKGYGMTMFEVANPSITVHDDSSATLHTGNSTSYGKASYSLDLSQASKSVGPNGEVTWSGVPVSGSLVGISASQQIGFDDLTFTAGSANKVSFGSSKDGGDDEKKYKAAATPPTTEGIEMLTPADKIREGGRVELKASGFDPEDEGVLVVLYKDAAETEPIVLDDEAAADESGTVEWSGTLPDKGTGGHVITLQGSTDAGAKIKILDAKDSQAAAKAASARADQGQAVSDEAAAAGIFGPGGMALWEWWVSAGALVAIAACTTTLALRQRRNLAAVSRIGLP